MGLESLLCRADESLWKKFGKITDISEKTFGWDKYDLAKSSSAVDHGCYTGGAGFLALRFSAVGDVGLASFFAIFTVGSVLSYGVSMYRIGRQKAKDEKDAINCVVEAPKAKSRRAFNIISSVPWSSFFIANSYLGDYVSEWSVDYEAHLTTGVIGGLALSVSLAFNSCTDYFLTQPSKPYKKSWVRNMYESLLSKPVPVPVRE